MSAIPQAVSDIEGGFFGLGGNFLKLIDQNGDQFRLIPKRVQYLLPHMFQLSSLCHFMVIQFVP
jgi:hypothetical protein